MKPEKYKVVRSAINNEPILIMVTYGHILFRFKVSGNRLIEDKTNGRVDISDNFKSKPQSALWIKTDDFRQVIRFAYSVLKAELHERHWIEALAAQGIKICNSGCVLVNRWGKEKPLKLESTKYDDIYSASRAQEHILKKYKQGLEGSQSELESLHSIEDALSQADSLFDLWSYSKPEYRKVIQAELLEIIEYLQRCRNPYKKEIYAQTLAIRDLKDSTGRENPGALRARIVAAFTRLTKRMEELDIIIPKISARKEVLDLTISELEYKMKRARVGLSLIFSAKNFFPPTYPRVLKNKIQKVIDNLQLISINPFLPKAKKAIKHLEIALHDIDTEAYSYTKDHVSLALSLLEEDLKSK